MKQKQRYLVLTLTAFMLAGCGLKGPLYMPTEQPPTEQQLQEQESSIQQITSPEQ